MENKKPSIFCFVTPFASPASVKHAEKLLNCMALIGRHVYFTGDRRVVTDPSWEHVEKKDVPTLPYVTSIRPRVLAYLIWMVNLLWILIDSSWYLFRKRKRIDIVICFLGLYYTPILMIARLFGLKAITFEPASDIVIMEKVYGAKTWWHLFRLISVGLLKINRTIADLIVIESYHVIQQGNLSEFLKKIKVANLYVDTNNFREITLLKNRKPIVGFLGRLSAEKGIRPFLMAARILQDSGYQFKIVGDGPLREEVENTIRSLEMSHIEYSGWLAYNDVPKFMNEIKLLVLPSSGEGMPNSVLEAMACSTPVLASPVGGIPDLIMDKKTGFILTSDHPESLASTIIDIMTNPELDRVSKQGQIHILDNYSFSASLKKWEEIFNEIHK